MVTLPVGIKVQSVVAEMSPEAKAGWLSEFRKVLNLMMEEGKRKAGHVGDNGASDADDRAANAYSNFRNTFGF